jgi:urease accessory protein
MMFTALPCPWQRFRTSAVFLLALLRSSPVFAHTGDTGGGFTSGLAHPIGGLDHVLAMVAVGVWGAQLGPPHVWLLPIAFPLMMACGAALGLMGYPLPGVEVGIACSAIALGLMVLLEAQPPQMVSLALAAFFALFHGHAHGTELPAGQSGLLYSFGFVISTGLLHAAGIGIGTLHHWQAGRVILRTAGAGVLGGGLFFLCRSIGWLS